MDDDVLSLAGVKAFGEELVIQAQDEDAVVLWFFLAQVDEEDIPVVDGRVHGVADGVDDGEEAWIESTFLQPDVFKRQVSFDVVFILDIHSGTEAGDGFEAGDHDEFGPWIVLGRAWDGGVVTGGVHPPVGLAEGFFQTACQEIADISLALGA